MEEEESDAKKRDELIWRCERGRLNGGEQEGG